MGSARPEDQPKDVGFLSASYGPRDTPELVDCQRCDLGLFVRQIIGNSPGNAGSQIPASNHISPASEAREGRT